MSIIKKAYLLQPAKVLLADCLNLRPGENLLVLTDSETVEYGEILALMGKAMGAEVVHGTMLNTRSRHGAELSPIVAAAMAAADAIVAPTTYSVNHTEARFAASKAGARLIFMPGVNDEVFRDGSLDIDFMERKETISRIGKVLRRGSIVRVTSPSGADFSMDIDNRVPVEQSGIVHEPGQISPPPSIEIAVAPVEGSLNGVMRVDGAVCPGGPVREPFLVRFEDGRIVDIGGGKDGEALSALLASYDDPNIYCAVEMGMGMNPNAEIGRAGDCEDEAVFGTMHIGIGEGATFGSSIHAEGHVDLVMLDAVIEVDNEIILKESTLYV